MFNASVIIPVYNAEKTLRKCVESLVYGRESNIEILLMEDCSTDKSWELCRELSKENQNVFCYKNEINRGVSYTRNKGLDYATAPYILFVDSDDWVSSKYVQGLLKCASKDANSLPICGYTYIDLITQTRTKYGCKVLESEHIELNEAFTLLDGILLQQLWNKVFCLDIIRNKDVHFDESLNMGEDFKFVLDYIEASECKEFFLIPESLYYYIRASKNSLMSGWSTQSLDGALERYEKLYHMCNDGSEQMKLVSEEHKRNLKYNFAYCIVRNDRYTKREQMVQLRQLLSEREADDYYWKQYVIKKKEKIAKLIKKMQDFCKRISNKLKRERNKIQINRAKCQLKEKDFSIISQNCIGGVFYHDMEMQFLSPTINTFIPEPDFVKFSSQLRYYLEKKIVMRWEEEYPIGSLDDVEIHFMHYETCKDAKESWERRKKRVNWDKIFILGTDRDGFDNEIYAQWKQISYSKILYTVNADYVDEAVYFFDKVEFGQIDDLIPKREFYKNGCLISKLNQI